MARLYRAQTIKVDGEKKQQHALINRTLSYVGVEANIVSIIVIVLDLNGPLGLFLTIIKGNIQYSITENLFIFCIEFDYTSGKKSEHN